MAERRMFSKTIVDSDGFLEMPLSTQCLYFHLSMRADDDGFVRNPKKIRTMIGASEDDMKLLLVKSFILSFESGVIVIRHWRLHNYIQKDRYKETVYKDEKALLETKGNIYDIATDQNISKFSESVKIMTEIAKNDDVSTGKVRLGKVSLGEDRLGNVAVTSNNGDAYGEIVEKWNQLSEFGIQKIRGIADGSERKRLLDARIKEYGTPLIIEAIESIKKSPSCQGRGRGGWKIKFDWFIMPGNFLKVLEGKYIETTREERVQQADELYTKCADEYTLPNDVEEKLREWISYFASTRKSLTEQTVRALIVETMDHVHEFGTKQVIGAINRSLAGGYKGIVWDYCKEQKTSPGQSQGYLNADGSYNWDNV